MHEVQGVIARTKGALVELTTILVPDPGPGEALVKVQSCGVCHTDLHYREGGINDDFPFLLGHEAAAVAGALARAGTLDGGHVGAQLKRRFETVTVGILVHRVTTVEGDPAAHHVVMAGRFA